MSDDKFWKFTAAQAKKHSEAKVQQIKAASKSFLRLEAKKAISKAIGEGLTQIHFIFKPALGLQDRSDVAEQVMNELHGLGFTTTWSFPNFYLNW